jgi:large subunit ribosomal protein L3
MKYKAKKLKMTQIWKDDRVVPVTPLQLDTEIFPEEFKAGEQVSVSGVSKGRGFQGVVKRHGFAGGPKTHGQKNRLRAPGSIGPTAPQRVIKGRKMAGHMGMRKVTVKNLLIAEIKPEEKLILVKGAVPGPVGREVSIRK